jgi:hypothetical protein
MVSKAVSVGEERVCGEEERRQRTKTNVTWDYFRLGIGSSVSTIGRSVDPLVTYVSEVVVTWI